LPEPLPEIIQQIQNSDWREGTDQPETIPHMESLEVHPEVQRAWDRYVEDKWLPWMEEHNAWETVHKVYSALFAIHQEQLRLGEEYELVLGLGLLAWRTPTGQRVRRHFSVWPSSRGDKRSGDTGCHSSGSIEVPESVLHTAFTYIPCAQRGGSIDSWKASGEIREAYHEGGHHT